MHGFFLILSLLFLLINFQVYGTKKGLSKSIPYNTESELDLTRKEQKEISTKLTFNYQNQEKQEFGNNLDRNVIILKKNTKDMITKINETNIKDQYHISNSGEISKKYKTFDTKFIDSLIRSFSLLMVSEFMDKTFIIILFFSIDLPPAKLIFFSGISLLFMNFFSIIIGFSLPYFLYRTLIEWIAIISFLILSIGYMFEAYYFDYENQEKIFNKIIKDYDRVEMLERSPSEKNLRPYKESKTVNEDTNNKDIKQLLIKKNSQENNEIPNFEIIQSSDNNDDVDSQNQLEMNYNENEEKKTVYALIYSIIVAECGDRSQFSTILLATVNNFSGVIIGSTFALIFNILLAVFLGRYITKIIPEKTLYYIAAIIFLIFGIEILITKIY